MPRDVAADSPVSDSLNTLVSAAYTTHDDELLRIARKAETPGRVPSFDDLQTLCDAAYRVSTEHGDDFAAAAQRVESHYRLLN